jgi:3-hydroxyacyl-CoA dehydrogenase
MTACCWAAAGYAVHIRDPSAAQRQEALQYIHQNEALYASVTDATPGSAQAFEHLRQAVEKAWLVFEAVPEKIQIKIDTFAELEALAPPDCILASISSSYKSLEMLDKVNDSTKTRILNTDYMRPPEKRIVELMTDGYTAKEIFPFLVQRHKEAGLYPFVARKESTGFIFNRIWAAITRECLMVLSEGVSVPEEIDSVSSEMYGSPIGPCRMMDSECFGFEMKGVF